MIERPDDPIGLQFIPDPAELVTAPHERADPIADDALSPIKGVVHRYPDRALLKPLLICPVYCRFCFRREHVGPDGGVLTETELQAAYDWFVAHPAIREVILTGGDPLMLSPRRLAAIVGALSAIPHIEMLRVHTRVPVADPARITERWPTRWTLRSRCGWCCTPIMRASSRREACVAIRRIQARAIPVLGQSVLLRGVNDSAEALEALFRAMLACAGQAVLPAPARSRPGNGALSRADRGRPPPAGAAARPRHRAGLAHLRAGHTGRARQGSDRSGLFGAGRRGARQRRRDTSDTARVTRSPHGEWNGLDTRSSATLHVQTCRFSRIVVFLHAVALVSACDF